MDNQHKKISGYRDLSQEEIDLMNELKAVGPQLENLINRVGTHLMNQSDAAIKAGNNAEIDRLDKANSLHWLMIAKDHLQLGLMAGIRAVAQPETF
ncbi:hypothetical protein [uncultured Zhongshania sp.]|uniref:Acb2/Tad1 domain-containing protein n=1 Tax=uncultured Zhongshania sp. TaxID=1642288 RepID=UPI0030DD3184